MGHRSDRGGNQVKITSFNRNTNLHSYWDSEIVEFVHKWSYSEWQYQIDRVSAEEEAKIVAGDFDTWAKEGVDIARGIYADTPEGTRVSYDYVAKYATTKCQKCVILHVFGTCFCVILHILGTWFLF